VSLDTNDFRHEMEPAAFGAYLDEEGLAAAQVAWGRQSIAGRQVRELYRRHAKALVQVGRGQGAWLGPATKRLGQRLEIVPAVNPYLLKAGQPLRATIWYNNRPLSGALVTLGDLDRPKNPLLKVRSGPDGKASFTMPKSGRWMMNVVWSVPSAISSADYQTSFSSLTFGVPAGR
jgi:uncharacterized GH25 family protein